MTRGSLLATLILVFAVSLEFLGCAVATEESVVTVALEPGLQTDDTGLNWSPKAASAPLVVVDDGLEGLIVLGSSGFAGFKVRLQKTANARYFDTLIIDQNRDGSLLDEEHHQTTPNESRYKMWSSFKSQLEVPVTDPETGRVVTNPYPISLWFVEDLRNESTELALRFTRSGWMQGTADLEGMTVHVRLSESRLDGVFTLDDEWTLALPDSLPNLFNFRADRPAGRHAWLGENAYKLIEVNPTGRTLTLRQIDPGVTRAQEAEDDDQMAVDRRAPRSGQSVVFASSFSTAEDEARSSGKRLFIDFETVWCGPCKSMEEWVYTADSVVDAARELIAVKVDGDDHPDIVKRFEVTGYPTMILVSPDGSIIRRLSGYQGVEAMTQFLTP